MVNPALRLCPYPLASLSAPRFPSHDRKDGANKGRREREEEVGKGWEEEKKSCSTTEESRHHDVAVL